MSEYMDTRDNKTTPPPDCTCYGRGQCASCTLARVDATGRIPDTEAARAVAAILQRR